MVPLYSICPGFSFLAERISETGIHRATDTNTSFSERENPLTQVPVSTIRSFLDAAMDEQHDQMWDEGDDSTHLSGANVQQHIHERQKCNSY
jgi:hypothetical protein